MKNGLIIETDGTQTWWLDDNLHREDGPSRIFPAGDEEWYRHGRLHREDGPAIIWANGSQYWYLNGKRYRTDGPAVIHADPSEGEEKWYLHNNDITTKVAEWIDQQGLPPWREWGDTEKILFRLTF